ncbi:integrase catalytic domain-containing protein [Nephila pilipes]|uniref:Integrase catalytic domain-containing protein n=1 Tax=Nephila pilipes TaxID=299642 RepID=A0A8X6QLZ2_NEPPI|nr:integrase catalytic domain-containing protein [Nephila pilipes]
MLLSGLVHAYRTNVQKYLGIQEARLKNLNHQALDSSTYNIDPVGPLPLSEGFRYCLPCVDIFSKWSDTFPPVEISEEAVAKVYTGWIARFGPPLRLTTDQRTQYKSSLFEALSKFLGTEK